MISSYILFNSFSFPYSFLPHTINTVPCSISSHFYPLTGAAPCIKLCLRTQGWKFLWNTWSSRTGWERSFWSPYMNFHAVFWACYCWAELIQESVFRDMLKLSKRKEKTAPAVTVLLLQCRGLASDFVGSKLAFVCLVFCTDLKLSFWVNFHFFLSFFSREMPTME